MSLKLNKYLLDLRFNANRLENIDINGRATNSFLGRTLRRMCFAASAASLVYFTDGGFSESFISYTSSVLSILIGLFITAIIFSFDKFYIRADLNNANSKDKLWDTQSYNFSKQFAYITGYSITLCIFTLALLSLSTLFEKKLDFKFHKYVFNFNSMGLPSVILFCKLFLVALQRFLVFYWIFRVMYNTLFVTSSMVKYMIVKIDKTNDSD